MKNIDVLIIGAGAAGLMCAIEAGKRGRSVAVVEHANKPGKKILMSGGGRCNFTNYHIHPDCYVSHNPHFCKSALSRYTQWDFINLVKQHRIPFHEKKLGQLFCDHKSKAILDMLLSECAQSHAAIALETEIESVVKPADHLYQIRTSAGTYQCESLVIASGGLSIPTMGASPLGYKIAAQFGIHVWPTRAGLVPFTLQADEKEKLSALSGVSVDSVLLNERMQFRENILFTHRGISGPAVLQISSYWNAGETVLINLLPDTDLFEHLRSAHQYQPHKQVNTLLSELLPRRLVETFLSAELCAKKLGSVSQNEFKVILDLLTRWSIKPSGTEGYRTAEVTLGGVDCDALSSKTMEAVNVKGLYFIGEVVDVTGWLGGYNFQWAWSSGWAAGQFA
ncbi:Ferredoxin--NADP reductase [Aquicella siphonis]|uniref:Ferredoxin--NADP reductase n=1 Tax=Aquicella siphonis TaxID=254247 RepID=A0A5E4PJA6_9COXI|nr:NAD(P)/FAD-dependent oxidoreductase [Aquicella siphonis]VVC76431.1 Ferredoxin--NADP reductase [Aquicella siphonis]